MRAKPQSVPQPVQPGMFGRLIRRLGRKDEEPVRAPDADGDGRRGLIAVTLRVNDLTIKNVDEIELTLRVLCQEYKLAVKRIAKGSSIVILDTTFGSEAKLATAFVSGELRERLHFEVQNVGQWSPSRFVVKSTSRRPDWYDTSSPESMVCHLDFINYHKDEHKDAQRWLGSAVVTSESKCVVYVARSPLGYLYAHSNFLKSGHKYPTKLITNELHDLFDLFVNLTRMEYPGDAEAQTLLQVHQKDVRYLLDDSLFDAVTDEIYLDLQGARRVIRVQTH